MRRTDGGMDGIDSFGLYALGLAKVMEASLRGIG